MRKARTSCNLVTGVDCVNFKILAGELTNGFSQDKLKSVVESVFTRGVELKNGWDKDRSYPGLVLSNGKVEIRQQAFKAAIQNLKSQIEVGRRNFLAESNEPMSEAVQHMYN